MSYSSVMGPLAIALLAMSLTRAESDVDFHEGFQSKADVKSFVKRNVMTFPPDSVLQVNVGITLTGQLERNSAVVVLAFQQNAHLPNETSPLFSPSLVVQARTFSIYDHLRDVLASYGLNGSECLRKMICQIGETPLSGGLLEDMITFVLSPSKHRKVHYGEVRSLLDSERLGKLKGNCTAEHPLCVRTPLDFISTFTHN